MLKRNLAVLVLVGALMAGGAYAWAQTSDGSPSAPTTQSTSTAAPTAQQAGPRQGRRANGYLKRVVHGDLIVRGKDGNALMVGQRSGDKNGNQNKPS